MSNKNDDFNFDEFAVNAIKYIDSVRSFGKSGGFTPNESRINAFYRAIGLPTVMPEKEQDWNGQDRPDDFNIDNVHSIQFTEDLKNSLDLRQSSFDIIPEDDEIKEFLDLNKQSIKASISTENARRRGVLFPLYVDGRIAVHPDTKRVGGAFMTESQLKHSKTTYKRPLIETILYIKLKGENIVDSSKQSGVSTAFQSVSLQELDENAIKRLNKTLNVVPKILEDSVKIINRKRSKTGISVVPTVANIVQQNSTTKTYENRLGELDIKKARQEDRKQIQNTILSLFEFNDIVGLSNARNLIGDGLASSLIDILTPSPTEKKNKFTKENKKTIEQLERATIEIKTAYRSLDLLLGTFSGISGVDILAIIIALFKMRNNYLVGLLNKNAQERLKKQKGEELPALKNATSLSESINKLEEEIKKIFDYLSESINIKKHKDKKHNQRETE